MDPTSQHIDPGSPQPPARASRRQVLALLRDVDRPLGIADVVERLGLHPNTVRLHLDGLVEAGLVTRGKERRDGRGRPRAVYTAEPAPRFEAGEEDQRGGDRGYRLLAQILTSHLEGTAIRPIEEAAAAGRAWGRQLAARRGPSARAAETASSPAGTTAGGETPDGTTARAASSVDETMHDLVALLDDLGFAPGSPAAGEEVELNHCPFGQVPGRHSPVVCAVHLGLMQGALAGHGSPVQATSVEPFVTPTTCVARFEGAGA